LALRITCIWTADSTGKTCLEGRQYVRPQDSPEGRKPYHGSAELLEGYQHCFPPNFMDYFLTKIITQAA